MEKRKKTRISPNNLTDKLLQNSTFFTTFFSEILLPLNSVPPQLETQNILQDLTLHRHSTTNLL